MAVTAFQDLPLADRDRAWDGAAAEKRVREWAGAEDGPEREVPRRARLVRRREQGQLHGVQAADRRRRRRPAGRGAARADGGAATSCRARAAASTCPHKDVDRVKSHLAKYYAKLGEEAPWER